MPVVPQTQHGSVRVNLRKPGIKNPSAGVGGVRSFRPPNRFARLERPPDLLAAPSAPRQHGGKLFRRIDDAGLKPAPRMASTVRVKTPVDRFHASIRTSRTVAPISGAVTDATDSGLQSPIRNHDASPGRTTRKPRFLRSDRICVTDRIIVSIQLGFPFDQSLLASFLRIWRSRACDMPDSSTLRMHGSAWSSFRHCRLRNAGRLRP